MDKTDKFRLNNEIVRMRKDVKKAKVYITHKLVRNIKNVKKKAANKQVEGFQRKIDKLVQELSILKKLGRDEISKFVLSNKKTPGEILTDSQSSIKERVLARFCGNKIVMAQADKIKEEFPNLDDLLCSLLQKRESKQKVKSTKNNNAVNNKKGQKFEDNLCQSSGGRLLLIKKDNDDSVSDSDKDINETIFGNSENESDAVSETDSTNIQTKPLTHKSLGGNSPSTEHKSKKRKTNTGKEENKRPKTEVDPFFLTDKGEYESCIVKDAVSPEPSSNQNNQLKAKGKYDNFKNKPSWKGQAHKEMNFSKKKFNEKQFQSKDGRNSKNFTKQNGRHEQISAPNKIEKIHPSWEAKKKEKEKLQSIHTFQGKKMTFDDE